MSLLFYGIIWSAWSAWSVLGSPERSASISRIVSKHIHSKSDLRNTEVLGVFSPPYIAVHIRAKRKEAPHHLHETVVRRDCVDIKQVRWHKGSKYIMDEKE